jgi:hypothetical protein
MPAIIHRFRGRSRTGCDLIPTTQRYMHLSPAALDAQIRLLEAGTDTGRAAVEK